MVGSETTARATSPNIFYETPGQALTAYEIIMGFS